MALKARAAKLRKQQEIAVAQQDLAEFDSRLPSARRVSVYSMRELFATDSSKFNLDQMNRDLLSTDAQQGNQIGDAQLNISAQQTRPYTTSSLGGQPAPSSLLVPWVDKPPWVEGGGVYLLQ